jgi:hypothetical protein
MLSKTKMAKVKTIFFGRKHERNDISTVDDDSNTTSKNEHRDHMRNNDDGVRASRSSMTFEEDDDDGYMDLVNALDGFLEDDMDETNYDESWGVTGRKNKTKKRRDCR